jgi:beta-phosphoglucomutase-like phosphatase (HAD superfamily)
VTYSQRATANRLEHGAAQQTGASLQAVLFDMDGTIVDTEPYWITAEYELVESFGGTWNDVHAHALVGNALLDSAAYIRAHGGVELPSEEIVERLMDRVQAACEFAIPWRPGAVRLLAELAEHDIPCALVTMSYERLARAVVDQLPAAAFAAVITGDQVRDGKPHPEAYLTAAERLGVDPARCVAIEDSPKGIASAEAAGCLVVGVPHRVPIPAAPGRVLARSLTEVDVAWLEQLISARPVAAHP